MQRIRPAIDALGRELGLEHALASKRLYTDGAEVLYDYAQHAGDTPEGESTRELVVVRNNQRVFSEVVELYLRRIDFAPDGLFRSGEPVAVVAGEFGLSRDEVEDAIRVVTRAAA